MDRLKNLRRHTGRRIPKVRNGHKLIADWKNPGNKWTKRGLCVLFVVVAVSVYGVSPDAEGGTHMARHRANNDVPWHEVKSRMLLCVPELWDNLRTREGKLVKPTRSRLRGRFNNMFNIVPMGGNGKKVFSIKDTECPLTNLKLLPHMPWAVRRVQERIPKYF